MRFLSTFKVPDVAIPVIDRIVAPDEVRLIEALAAETFGVEDTRSALEKSTGEPWPDARLLTFLDQAYKRGVIRLRDESFTKFEVSSFYDRLEVFAVTESDAYRALPRETQKALDRWYLESYCKSLGDDVRPTGDRIETLAGTLDYLDTVERPIWLNHCDCRTLAGQCDKPTDTCISFRNGINTMSHRGWSKPLTREEAKGVVRMANGAGLMQTVNDDGICNCCADCCYLFRAQKVRGTGTAWPLVQSTAEVDPSLCIGCGVCVSRCPFGALELEGDEIVQHAELCQGCGLCREICPTFAISMVPRHPTERDAQ